MAQENSNASTKITASIGAIAKVLGVLISASSLLRIIKQHAPGMRFGELANFLVETYRATIYPVLEFTIFPIAHWLNISIVDPWRDIIVIFMIVQIAFIRLYYRSQVKGRMFAKSETAFHFLFAFLLSLAWPVLLAFMIIDSANFRDLRTWGLEVFFTLAAVLVALIVNLIQTA